MVRRGTGERRDGHGGLRFLADAGDHSVERRGTGERRDGHSGLRVGGGKAVVGVAEFISRGRVVTCGERQDWIGLKRGARLVLASEES